MKQEQDKIMNLYWDTLSQYGKVETDTIKIVKKLLSKKYKYQLSTSDKSLVARFNDKNELVRIVEANQLLVELILQSTQPLKYPKKRGLR